MNVEIRIANEADAEAIIGIYGPYCDATTVSFELAAPAVEQMRERIRRVLESYPWIVAQIDGQVAGYVYASQHRERAAYRWAVDVAIYIAGQEHRRGIGQALYSALFSILRKQGYFQAFAGITLPNSASVGLHERMGFRRCASFTRVGFKLGQWLDVGWWQLELQPQRFDPPEPCAFAAFREGPLVSSLLAEETQTLIGTLTNRPSKKS